MSTPLLILSDSPSSTTGLGRICKDLATRLHAHCSDIFRVGTLGYGGPGSREFGFTEYHLHSIENWLVPELADVWQNFAGNERGILLTIWDPSRLRWLARPDSADYQGRQLCPPHLKTFLKARPFELWGYIPVDATGPNGKLTAQIADCLMGYDRLLAYSEWAGAIIGKTLNCPTVESLPHGIDTKVWKAYPRKDAKRQFRELGFDGLTDDAFLVGMVATNQARKDFGLGMETCAKLLQSGMNVRVWIHTDTSVRYWNIPALVEDFGLGGRVVITVNKYSDEQMAWLYSACDVTLGIGLGEGFGYPIFESLACGTPCIHGNYGGAAEHMPESMSVAPTIYRLDGQFNCARPVYHDEDWCEQIQIQRDEEEDVQLPPALEWQTLWPRWEKWFREGVKA